MPFSERESPEGFTPDPATMAAIRERVMDGKLSCASAFEIVHALNVDPLDVGWTANVMEVRLYRCQLGLYGYPGKHGWAEANTAGQPVPPGLPEALTEARDEEGKISCATAWEIAARFQAPRIVVGYVADSLGIAFKACQLGAW
jgi:hypothetical protein